MMTNQQKLAVLMQNGNATINTARSYLEARDFLGFLVREAGVELVFDPGAPASLTDYAAASGLGAVAGGLAGASIGSLLGSLFDRPAEGAIVGAIVFAVAGASSSMTAVDRGFRVRVRAPVESLLLLERL